MEKTENDLVLDWRTGYDRRKSRWFDPTQTYFIEHREVDDKGGET